MPLEHLQPPKSHPYRCVAAHGLVLGGYYESPQDALSRCPVFGWVERYDEASHDWKLVERGQREGFKVELPVEVLVVLPARLLEEIEWRVEDTDQTVSSWVRAAVEALLARRESPRLGRRVPSVPRVPRVPRVPKVPSTR